MGKRAVTLLCVSLSVAMLMNAGTLGIVFATDNPSQPAIPPQLLDFISSLPRGSPGCVSGNVQPFTITSTKCEDSAQTSVQNQYTLNCSTNCKSGVVSSATSPAFVSWQSTVTAPSNPSKSYSYPTSVSYWVGLQNCLDPIVSCNGNNAYLIQAGFWWGANPGGGSSSPLLFEEFISPSGTCHTTFCGTHALAMVAGHTLFLSVNYFYYGQYWTAFAEDTTTGQYADYFVYYGTGTYQIPYKSLPVALSSNEGHGATTSSYYPPGTFTFGQEYGDGYNAVCCQIGSQTPFGLPLGTAPTSTVTYTTYSCNIGGTQTTCQTTSVKMS